MTPLHHFGQWVRDLLMQIPMPVVRGVVIAFFAGILCWVWSLPRERTVPIDRMPRWDEKLKWVATVALGAQIIIYGVF